MTFNSLVAFLSGGEGRLVLCRWATNTRVCVPQSSSDRPTPHTKTRKLNCTKQHTTKAGQSAKTNCSTRKHAKQRVGELLERFIAVPRERICRLARRLRALFKSFIKSCHRRKVIQTQTPASVCVPGSNK